MYGRFRGGPRGPRKAPPVRVGEEIDVIIEAVGEKGDGIAKKDGFILFVKETKQGETCRVRVTKVLQKVGFADKIGPAESVPQPSEPAQRRPMMPAPEPEPAYEDTEDFGEEPVAPAEEEPAEVAAEEEAPAEVPAETAEPEEAAEAEEEVQIEIPSEEPELPPEGE